MMSKIIKNWLEEGFIDPTGTKSEVRNENSLIPVISNEKGIIQTPKPLYTCFMKTTKLDPEFLPQHLEEIQKKFLSEASINLDKYLAETRKHRKSQEDTVIELKAPRIEYDRKNIFLSRVMFNLFEIPDYSVSKGSVQYQKVLEKNELYQKALERREKFPNNFIEECLQTDLVDSSEKQIETMPLITENKNCMVNKYLMKKHYERQEMKIKPPPKTFKEFCNSKSKFSDYEDFLKNINNYPQIHFRFKEALYIVEKTLNYNTNKKSILEYNGYKADISDGDHILQEITDELNDERKVEIREHFDVKLHLRFHVEIMKNDYRVTCIECSPINESIFVVGYGVSHFKEMDHNIRGMVLCWNIHKCGYPEKIYYTEEIVTCLEFSRTEPYLVAVGMRYGLIAIFDLRKSESYSSINNYSSKVKPVGTIKNIRWVKRKYAMGKEVEVLVTVSMDGIICCWSHSRQLDGRIMRYVKREGNINEEQKMVVATHTAGMCMQIKPNSNETFIIGTIEGQALQAEINDPESYTYFYNCHNGPLYDLQWSPLVADVFMTCGTDCFVHIWQTGKAKPSKSLSLEDIALNIAWSCVKSTLFAVMCEKKILFFDLSINPHKEIAQFISSNSLTFRFLTFCPKNNWFLVGQSNGTTELFELVNIPPLKDDPEQALKDTFLSD